MRSFRVFAVAMAVTACWLMPNPERTVRAAPQPSRSAIARFRASMRRILAQREAARADWGILVADQGTGRTLYERNATHYFTPASNAKLFTAALALAELGPQYRWRTTLESSGRIDSAGTLEGDLVLVGRGDPNLSNRVFPFGEKEQFDGPPDKALADLADQLVAKGVKRIKGDIVADDSYFTYDRYLPGWTIDNFTAGYGAPVSAIVIDDNTLEVDVSPGARPGDGAAFQVLPWPAFYHFIDWAKTEPERSGTDLELKKEPDSLNVRLEGVIAAGAGTQKLYIGIEQPARYAAALLKHLLLERGVAVSGVSRAVHLLPNQRPPAPVARQVLAEHDSPTLGEDVRFTLKVSQNLHAECLLRTVAHVKTGVGSVKNGLEIEKAFLRGLGIEGDVALYDGSGLSHYDLVTPRAIVTLLRYAARQSWAAIYRNALPDAGRDGTLDDRMDRMAANGRVLAKTGTLMHDRSLSGYATTLNGKHLVFSIMVNNIPPGAKFNPIIDEIADAMVKDWGGRARRLPGRRPTRPR
ncbi:MAG TPA: D-alanyl-D-alanine carboxypeptidase/D-alanyl-D-alanine-endopeptidase [Patescibacteria group bacterium]|nr:D-alanyl-D-alanine carboxypeptidase/D-alanyl-D-alanine-endopeptidase [Patescibacteria group bacterium]